MKVLLIKDVKSLGKTGEVKEVKDGYGKNFLIAKGFAKHATDEVLEQWAQEQADIQAKIDEEIAVANKIKAQIEASKFTVRHKVGANGHLIGSVTNKEISEIMAAEGIELDKKAIHLENKIKTPGIFNAECKLGHAIHASAKIDVVGIE